MTNKDVLKIIGDAQCPKHTRWQKKRKPASTCQNCWLIWIMRQMADGTLELNFVD